MALIWLLLFAGTASAQTHKSISRQKLEYYLAHSVNALAINDYCKSHDGLYPGTQTVIVDPAELNALAKTEVEIYLKEDLISGDKFERYKDMLRLIRDVKAKFVTEAVTQWGAWDWSLFLNRCAMTAKDLKAIDTEIIVQASVNEFVGLGTLDAVGDIPAWVWQEFGLPDEHRKFDLSKMMFGDCMVNARHRWTDNLSPLGYPTAIVPDISRLESQMWFYYQVRLFIDMGCESVQFSQVELMNNESRNPQYWAPLFERLRRYADNIPSIRFFLITGHTNGMKDESGKLAFDFHSSPMRPSEQTGNYNINGGGCRLTTDQCWGQAGKIYNNSLGGIAPSGWSCASLPALVFTDNYGNKGKEDDWGQPLGEEGCNIYHFDEISWFALQSKAYRDKWLLYAYNKVHAMDPNVWLALPVKRVVTSRGYWYPTDYLANTPNNTYLPAPKTHRDDPAAVVDRQRLQIYAGYGQESIIRDILAGVASADWDDIDLNIAISPNPANEVLLLNFQNYFAGQPFNYSLFDITGRLVAKSQVMSSNAAAIPTGNLSNGIHILYLSDPKGKMVLRTKVIVAQ